MQAYLPYGVSGLQLVLDGLEENVFALSLRKLWAGRRPLSPPAVAARVSPDSAVSFAVRVRRLGRRTLLDDGTWATAGRSWASTTLPETESPCTLLTETFGCVGDLAGGKR